MVWIFAESSRSSVGPAVDSWVFFSFLDGRGYFHSDNWRRWPASASSCRKHGAPQFPLLEKKRRCWVSVSGFHGGGREIKLTASPNNKQGQWENKEWGDGEAKTERRETEDLRKEKQRLCLGDLIGNDTSLAAANTSCFRHHRLQHNGHVVNALTGGYLHRWEKRHLKQVFSETIKNGSILTSWSISNVAEQPAAGRLSAARR